MPDRTRRQPETDIAQALHYVDAASGAIVPPLSLSTTFARDDSYRLPPAGHHYARDQNPTFEPAEAMLARLEGAADARLFASGMAAAAALVQAAVRPGAAILAPSVMYWGLRDWLIDFGTTWGVAVDFFDPADPADLARKLRPGTTRLVWVETPCNPSWDIIDIRKAADDAHAAGALLAVDSTVATPVLTRPIEHGADFVMHSATKYLNGHGDIVAGALATARENETWKQVLKARAYAGAIPGSFEAWLLQRGMRTLFLRVRRASETALALARHLQQHPQIARVLYPGLDTHPGHDIARRQMRGGFGGMLSIRLHGGRDAALRVANRLQVFIRATSLGGVESLVEHRKTIEGTHSPVPDDLLRLSVGIESPDDLRADLDQAL